MNFSDIPMDASWRQLLLPEFEKPYMLDLKKFLDCEIASGKTVYPPIDLIFNALFLTPFDEVKVVILGQDPYHGPGQAEGLCFSVPKTSKKPPSLQNIFKELHTEFQIPTPASGSLRYLAKQGVLLLNTTLTVREGLPKSHFNRGWEMFTKKIIQLLCHKNSPLVFLLWGKSAIEQFQFVKTPGKLVLTAPHPSPLSAYTGFFGCNHFSNANAFLKVHNIKEINWSPPSES